MTTPEISLFSEAPRPSLDLAKLRVYEQMNKTEILSVFAKFIGTENACNSYAYCGGRSMIGYISYDSESVESVVNNLPEEMRDFYINYAAMCIKAGITQRDMGPCTVSDDM